MRLYADLAPWFHLLTHPSDYESEAEHIVRVVEAAVHLRPGGIAVFQPDTTQELLELRTSHGGHDGDDGRGLRYLEWMSDPVPGDTTYDVDFLIALRETGKELRVVHDHHVFGVFPEQTWRRLVEQAGLELVDLDVDDPTKASM